MATALRIRSLLLPPDPADSRAGVLAAVQRDCQAAASSAEEPLAGLLSTLLSAHRASHEDLTRQLDASTASLSSCLSHTVAQLSQLSPRAQTLHDAHLTLEDELIDYRELLVPSASPDRADAGPPTPTLLAELETQQARLAQLAAARSYFAVLEALEASSLRVRGLAESGRERWHEAVAAWNDLARQCQKVGETAKGLTAEAFARGVAVASWHHLDGIAAATIGEALDEIHWPLPATEALSAEKRAIIQAAFSDGILLQKAAESSPLRSDAAGGGDDVFPPRASVPMRALAQPIILRFRYHFDGDRQTNRLDKPEWFLNHVFNSLSEREAFLRGEAQDLLHRGGYPQGEAFPEFARLLVCQAARKLRRTVPQILAMPEVLAHTIYQALDFDAKVREAGYDLGLAESSGGGAEDGEWEGIAKTILGNEEWFDTWLEAERQFADRKYYDIISSPEAWQLSADYHPSPDAVSSLVPTTSALRIRDLFDLATSRYSALPSAYRAPFLLKVQIPILEGYISRVDTSLDAFESLGFGLMRAAAVAGVGVPGGMEGGSGTARASAVGGTVGAVRLVKAWVSGQWMTEACQAWNDDVFFLELLDDLGSRWPRLRSPELRATAQKVLEATRDPSLSDGPTLWGPYEQHFARLAQRAEELLAKHVVREVTHELKPYISKRWDFERATTGEDGLPAEADLSPEVVPALTLWSSLLKSLAPVLPAHKFLSFFRRVAAEVCEVLVSRLVLSRSVSAISESGGRQLLFDTEAGWIGALRGVEALKGRDARRAPGLQRMVAVARLLALPAAADEPPGGAPPFSRVMKASFGDDDAEFDRILRLVAEGGSGEGSGEGPGPGMSRAEVQAVMRRRPECWR